MLWVAIIGLVMTVLAVAVAGRRALFLYKLATVGPPAPERIDYAKTHAADEAKAQLVEVFGQKKLLKWTPSGTAHFFVMWAFFILLTVYIEAYGAIVQGRSPAGPTSTSRSSGPGACWASCRTSSRSRAWRASRSSRASGSRTRPRSSAAARASPGPTWAARGSCCS